SLLSSCFKYLTGPQRLDVVFSEDVGWSVQKTDLLLQNANTGEAIPSSSINVSYGAASNTAAFHFPGFNGGTLPDGNYQAFIAGSGITDVAGNPVADYSTSFFF